MSVNIRYTDDGKYIVTITDGGTVTAHKCDNILAVGELIDKMEDGKLETERGANGR